MDIVYISANKQLTALNTLFSVVNMDEDNDAYILNLLDESLKSSVGGNLDYDSDNFVEIFDDDTDADPDFVFSESEIDEDVNQPGPSRPITSKTLVTSTPNKKRKVTRKPRPNVQPNQPRHTPESDEDSSNSSTSDGQPTTTNQAWRHVDMIFNVYPYNPDPETVGINPDVIETMSNCMPIDFLKLFLDEEVLSLLVTETNRYAQQCLQVAFSPHSRLAKWTDCTNEEMQNFFGILIMMGLQQLPTVAHYWRQDDLYITRIPDIMSRNRFELILRMFHCADNTAMQEGDRLHKIANFVSIMNDKFKMHVIPKDKVCIDESVVPFLGRLVFRQYLKNKRHRYGVKIFKLCVEGGYTLTYRIYSGKEKEPSKDVSAKIVMELMEPYLNFGRTVFTDNWYTSVNLAKSLGENKTHLVGTLRKNRKNIPKEVVAAKLKRGEIVAKKNDDNIVVLKWKDKRDVLMLSTKHGDGMQEINVKGGKTKMKPDATIDYNNAKSYIDYTDQMGSYSTPLRRSVKWYRKIVVDMLLTTSVINALFLFKTVTGQSMKITEFKESLCRDLKKKPSLPKAPENPQHSLVKLNNRSKCARCYSNHFKKGGRQLAQKKTKKVHTKCLQCDSFFCTECFYIQHSVKSK